MMRLGAFVPGETPSPTQVTLMALAKVAHDRGAEALRRGDTRKAETELDGARGLIVIAFGLEFLRELERHNARVLGVPEVGPHCAWPRTPLEVVE